MFYRGDPCCLDSWPRCTARRRDGKSGCDRVGPAFRVRSRAFVGTARVWENNCRVALLSCPLADTAAARTSRTTSCIRRASSSSRRVSAVRAHTVHRHLFFLKTYNETQLWADGVVVAVFIIIIFFFSLGGGGLYSFTWTASSTFLTAKINNGRVAAILR